jgi:hypothetical protein
MWQAPALRSHALVVLTLSKLYLAPAGSSVKPETANAVQNGADLDEVFGPNATVILLPTIRRVLLDLPVNRLTIEFVPADGAVERLPVRSVTIECADPKTADEIFSKIWRRLGDRFALIPYRRTTWELARTPVAIMAGVAIATLALSLILNVAADTGSGALGEWGEFMTLDWRWVCGVGGTVLALLQIWLYRRLTQPPAQLDLILK